MFTEVRNLGNESQLKAAEVFIELLYKEIRSKLYLLANDPDRDPSAPFNLEQQLNLITDTVGEVLTKTNMDIEGHKYAELIVLLYKEFFRP